MSGRPEMPRVAVPAGVRDHIQGLATAPVTLVEYGDYECLYRGSLSDRQRGATAPGRSGTVRLSQLPLTTAHPHAQHAAEAAEAAGAQGRF